MSAYNYFGDPELRKHTNERVSGKQELQELKEEYGNVFDEQLKLLQQVNDALSGLAGYHLGEGFFMKPKTSPPTFMGECVPKDERASVLYEGEEEVLAGSQALENFALAVERGLLIESRDNLILKVRKMKATNERLLQLISTR